MANKAKTWSQYQNQIINDELKAKEAVTKDSPIVSDLKDKGKIKEAAAVFSYEGFNFLIESLGDIVATKVSEMVDRKILEAMEGFQEGLARAVHHEAKHKIDEVISRQMDTSIKEQVMDQLFKEPEKIEELSEEELEILTRPENEGETKHKKIKKETPSKPKRWTRRDEKDIIRHTFTGFEIPRTDRGAISWKVIGDNEQLKEQIYLHYFHLAAQEYGEIFNSSQFKKVHPDSNAVYQRMYMNDKETYGKMKELYFDKYHA